MFWVLPQIKIPLQEYKGTGEAGIGRWAQVIENEEYRSALLISFAKVLLNSAVKYQGHDGDTGVYCEVLSNLCNKMLKDSYMRFDLEKFWSHTIFQTCTICVKTLCHVHDT